jgi:hypothetical protein
MAELNFDGESVKLFNGFRVENIEPYDFLEKKNLIDTKILKRIAMDAISYPKEFGELA